MVIFVCINYIHLCVCERAADIRKRYFSPTMPHSHEFSWFSYLVLQPKDCIFGNATPQFYSLFHIISPNFPAVSHDIFFRSQSQLRTSDPGRFSLPPSHFPGALSRAPLGGGASSANGRDPDHLSEWGRCDGKIWRFPKWRGTPKSS